MLQQFKANGNTKMLGKLEAAPVTMAGGTPPGYLAVRDPAMHRLGIGTTHDMRSIITGIFLRSLVTPDYTLREKINMWRAKFGSGVSLGWDEVISTDLREMVVVLMVVAPIGALMVRPPSGLSSGKTSACHPLRLL